MRLELVAWPKAKIRVGQKVHLQVVGRATSSSSGSYAIHSSVALPQGIHNLEVLARSSVAVGAFSFARKVAQGGRALVAVDGSASTGPVEANIHMLALPKSAVPAVPHSGPGPICDPAARKVREFGPRWVSVGGLYSLMVDGKMKMTYTAGSNTTMGVGISLPGDVGFSAEGTFTQTSSGAEQFPTQIGKIVNEQTPYTYGEYGLCGMIQVQPEVWVTGSRTVNVMPPPIDGKCSLPFQGGEVFTRSTGTAGTFTAGVDLKKEIGINLSAQSGYNKNVSITYRFPSGGFLCGTNNYPSVAAFDEMDPVSNTTLPAGRTSRSK